MRELINEMLEKKKWAVIGATQNVDKYGYKVYMMLKNCGYEVYAVNPVYDAIEGDLCYNTLHDLPVKVDCVSVVIGPVKSIYLIDEVVSEEIENIWFQPKTYDSKIIKKAKDLNLNAVYGECVLVQLKEKYR